VRAGWSAIRHRSSVEGVARRPAWIGASSGYPGDGYSALDEVMTGDAVDVIIGESAEITVVGSSSRRTDICWIEYAVQRTGSRDHDPVESRWGVLHCAPAAHDRWTLLLRRLIVRDHRG
jgi:hypothetical protein